MTDERLCARCGYERSGAEHDGFETDIIRDVLLPGPRHPFEAAPSTDEGEAHRVSTREEDRRGLWPGSAWRLRNAMGEPVELFVPEPIVAAIRAPLEERIRELEARAQVAESNQDFLASAFDADGPFDRLQVENERLREALRRIVEYREGTDQPHEVHVLWSIARRALATPPSSTEGTKEGGE